MRPVDIKTINYRGNRAARRRQPRNWKLIGIVVGSLVVLLALGYGLFFTSWFRVTSIAYQGLNDEHKAEIQKLVDQDLGRKLFHIPIGSNILFFSSGKLQADISQLPFLEQASVRKNYTHTITISGTERKPEGVWCFNANSPDQDCKYFDDTGVAWGDAVQSSGFLLLNVNDDRIASGSPAVVDPQFLKGIQTVMNGLTEQGVKAKGVEIPANSFTEFDVNVADGYPIKFSLDSDLPGQVSVYTIFRNQKLANGDFRPQYLDLRFDGRVYYK